MELSLGGIIPGFLLGASLIIAIGAQNAYVLRQGLLKEHVFILCMICAVSDAMLITLGVTGFGAVILKAEWTLIGVTFAGAIFLFGYGFKAFQRAFNPEILRAAEVGATSLSGAVVTCLALTFLNPHVYLDTVILLGGISAKYGDEMRFSFGFGAVLASFIWFFTLGYAARLMSRVFQKPVAWRILDSIIGAVMWMIAFSLLNGLGLMA